MGRGLGLVAGIFALAGAGPADGQSFLPPTSWPSTDAQNVVIGDLNKDPIPDLATADGQPPQASVLLGTGNAGFGTTVGLPLAGHPHDIAAADFDGDTDVDLAVSEQDTGNVAILPNQGDGSFGARIGVPAATNAYALAVGDVNGDTKADLVVGDTTSNQIAVVLGDGAGSFAAPVTSSLVTGNPSDLALADLNGDFK